MGHEEVSEPSKPGTVLPTEGQLLHAGLSGGLFSAGVRTQKHP